MTTPPTIFLVGPHGVGKTTLGTRACAELGLRFLDLAADKAGLKDRIQNPEADVVSLPWSAIGDRGALASARRSGVVIGLWAHPNDMQTRSGRTEPLFTPAPRLKSGFGRTGIACPEYRQLDRACQTMLAFVGTGFEESLGVLKQVIERKRVTNDHLPAAARAGIAR